MFLLAIGIKNVVWYSSKQNSEVTVTANHKKFDVQIIHRKMIQFLPNAVKLK